MLDITITATNYVVTATETAYNFTVSSDNSLFTVTDVSYVFTVTNNVTQVSFEDGGGPGFDPAVKFRGDWVSGTVYTRNDLVNYAYSLYVCQIEYNTTLTSTTPPPSDSSNWIRIVWKEAPFAWVTSTGFVDVGTNLSVGASARIAGNLGVTGTTTLAGPLTVSNNTGTFQDLNVTRQFNINGLNYPVQKGSFGQVLYTNGSTTATWANLGDLQSWSLNADLYTNEFNIVTGIDDTTPNLKIYRDLTIGTGETGDFQAFLKFDGGRKLYSTVQIAPEVTLRSEGSLIINVDDTLNITGGATSISGSSIGLSALGGISVVGALSVSSSSYFTGSINGSNSTNPVIIGAGGLLFPDGSVQLSASTGTAFTATQIASADRLGVIRVGQYLSINSGTGVLSVDRDTLKNSTTWYTLPIASASTLGGIRVGSGLNIDAGTGILSVASTVTSTVGNISLSEDMETNGYYIRYNTTTNATTYLYLASSDVTINAPNSVQLNADSGGNLLLSNGSVVLTAGATIVDIDDNQDTVFIKANETVIGQNANNSTLQIQRIYNYAGTNAPFFPAGVQYPDNSIQITAFYPDQGLLI